MKKINKYVLIILAGLLMLLTSILELTMPVPNFFISCLLSIISVIVCYGIITVFFLDRTRNCYFDIKFNDFTKSVLVALFTVLICYFFQNMIFNLLYCTVSYIPEKYECLVNNIIFEKNNYSVIQNMVLIFAFGIITPLFEELFFRFVLLENFSNTSFILKFVFVNFCFILVHDNISLMIFVFPLSIICSIMLHYTKKFIYPFVIHCIVNIVGILEIPIDEVFFSPKYAIEYKEESTALINVFFNLMIVVFLIVLLFGLVSVRIQKNIEEISIRRIDNLFYTISIGIYILLNLIII